MNNSTENQKFLKDLFSISSGWLEYWNGEKSIFIARFKYSGSPVKASHFKTALIKNFTPTEWVELMKQHQGNPTEVVETKLPNWSKNICEKWKARELAKMARN